MKFKPHESAYVKDQQLLGIIHGSPGCGKTFTAKKLAEQMNLRILFTGTTHTAAKELQGYTINELLKLGENKSNFTYTTIKADNIQWIQDKLKDIDLLVIDEASMLTPVTLARIDLHLTLAFENYAFGGKDILLIGDFWQFPPVDEYLKYPALYQATVREGRGQSTQNDAYKKGTTTFMLFKMMILNGQERATPQYNEWLSKLRDPNVECPITDPWISKLNILTAKDITSKSKIDWTFTPTIVSGNHERRSIIQYKIKLFGKRYNEPILRWICKVKIAKVKNRNKYVEPEWDPEDIYPEIIQYFVRGTECVLTGKVHDLRKGTIATYIGVVWADKNDEKDIDTLPIGQVTTVKQPEYIIVEIITDKEKKIKKTIPIKAAYTTFKQNVANGQGGYIKKKRAFLRHPTELTISKTYHKTQGGNYNDIILSINSCSKSSLKIKKLSITSLYVGLSRVHDFNEHRVLPISKEDIESLKNLKHDPLLKIFFNNYDKDGNWKYDGLKQFHQNEVRQAKLNLGMIDFDSLIIDDCKLFEKPLDLILESKKKNIQNYKNALKEAHAEGKKLLEENNGIILLEKHIELKKQLIKHNLQNMSKKDMRYYAKRLGIKNVKTIGIYQLRIQLETINKQTKSLCHGIRTNINTKQMDIENYHSDNNINLNETYTDSCQEDDDIDLNEQHNVQHVNAEMNIDLSRIHLDSCQEDDDIDLSDHSSNHSSDQDVFEQMQIDFKDKDKTWI